MAALSVMLAAVGSLCGAIEREAVDPALYGEKSRAAVAQTHGMRDDDAVTTYIGMDAARQHDVAQTIALYMAPGGEDAPLAVDELNEKEISHMNDVRRLIALCRTMRTGCISLAAGLAVAMAWVGATMEKRHRPVMIGAVCRGARAGGRRGRCRRHDERGRVRGGVRRPASADFHQLKLAAQPDDGYSDSDDAAGAV